MKPESSTAGFRSGERQAAHARRSVPSRDGNGAVSRKGAKQGKGGARAFAYPARFSNTPGGRVLVKFVDLPRVATDGRDFDEAFQEAMDALGSDLSIRLTRREDIPAPPIPKRGQRLVPVPWWLAPKLALYLAMREQGVRNAALARLLKVDERVVRRMLDPAHETKAEKIQAALAAMGKRIVMNVEDAA